MKMVLESCEGRDVIAGPSDGATPTGEASKGENGGSGIQEVGGGWMTKSSHVMEAFMDSHTGCSGPGLGPDAAAERVGHDVRFRAVCDLWEIRDQEAVCRREESVVTRRSARRAGR